MVAEKKYDVTSENGISCVKITGIGDFDISKVFDCGQCFRFDRVRETSHSSEFSGVAFGRFISVAQDGDELYIYNSTAEEYESLWRHYFALDEDYGRITADIISRSDNPALARAVRYGSGIRILRQEPWETVCSFIISQNNNIPRIKKLVEELSSKCGEPVDVSGIPNEHFSGTSSLCSFPSAAAVAKLGVSGLEKLKTGFRAKYIYDAAVKCRDGVIDFSHIKSVGTSDAVEYLSLIKGVGPKVASCALLFGFGKYDAFPVDVWIKKAIAKYFTSDGGEFVPSLLGEYAGIAQQYLFYYERYCAE